MSKRLYRSRTDKMLGGLCAGLAKYFDLDPTLVRLGVAFGALWAGTGVLAYIIGWIIVPEEPYEP